jgi:hypothetical protein
MRSLLSALHVFVFCSGYSTKVVRGPFRLFVLCSNESSTTKKKQCDSERKRMRRERAEIERERMQAYREMPVTKVL